jgi:hypothetical protein
MLKAPCCQELPAAPDNRGAEQAIVVAEWIRTFLANVLIYCPLIEGYGDPFDAMVFVVVARGFQPRSAHEGGDSGEVRMEQIARLIRASPRMQI